MIVESIIPKTSGFDCLGFPSTLHTAVRRSHGERATHSITMIFLNQHVLFTLSVDRVMCGEFSA